MEWYLSCSLGSRCLAIGRADPRLPGEIWDNILGRLLDGPSPSLFFFFLFFFGDMRWGLSFCAHQGVGVRILIVAAVIFTHQ